MRIALPVALLAACAGAAFPALAGATHRRTAAENRQAALRDARGLVARVVLPPGAHPAAKGRHYGLGRDARPGPAEVKMVDQRAFWKVDKPFPQVLSYVQTHSPTGGRLQMSGSSSGPGQPVWEFVTFTFPPRPGILGIRWLTVTMIQLHDGSTGVRVDGQVQWVVPRPESEKVPAGVHAVQVTRAGSSPISRTVTAPAKVRALIALTDRLPTLQSGSWSCPAGPPHPDLVTVSFLQHPGGPALARASVDAQVGPTNTGCDAMSFRIGQRRQTPLVRARHFLRAVGRVLGVRVTERW